MIESGMLSSPLDRSTSMVPEFPTGTERSAHVFRGTRVFCCSESVGFSERSGSYIMESRSMSAISKREEKVRKYVRGVERKIGRNLTAQIHFPIH